MTREPVLLREMNDGARVRGESRLLQLGGNPCSSRPPRGVQRHDVDNGPAPHVAETRLVAHRILPGNSDQLLRSRLQHNRYARGCASTLAFATSPQPLALLFPGAET